MFAPALRLAAGKAAPGPVREALEALLSAAQQVDEAEAAMPAEIARRKAERGEAPPKLPRPTREMLDGLAADQAAGTAEMMAAFAAEPQPAAIVWSLAFALRNHLPLERQVVKRYPAADRPLGEAHLERKRALLAQLDAFLEQHPAG